MGVHYFYGRMLHLFDINKRLESHLTEILFRRTYAKKYLSSEAVYGVIKFSRSLSGGRFETVWLAQVGPDWKIPDPIRAIVERRPRDAFYLYRGGVSDFSVGHISLEIRKVCHGAAIVKDDGMGAEIRKKINNKIDEINRRDSKAGCNINSGYNISHYIPAFSDEELSDLYLSRCMMNYGLSYPTDVDAIDVGAQGEFRIFEFKRKDPSGGYYKPSPFIKVVDYKRRWKDISGKIKPFAGRGEVLEVLQDSIPCVPVVERCFGLDLYSHVGTVMDTVFYGGSYNYVIWNRSPCGIENLIDADLQPVGGFDLLECRALNLRNFCGFNFTEAIKSGSVHEKNISGRPRMQLMIKLSDFSKVQLS